MTVLEAIAARRSVRAYTPARPDAATIRSLLRAAVQAPTAVHEEPWLFAVVQDPATLKRYSDRTKISFIEEARKYRELRAGEPAATRFFEQLSRPEFSIFYDAPTLVVICAKPLGPYVAADCWLAGENLMLAATSLGLGTCCIGSAVPVLNEPDVKAELGIPEDALAVAPIVVGVPRGETPKVPRKEPEIVCWK